MRRAVGIFVFVPLSLGLLYLLLSHAGLDWSAIIRSVRSVGWLTFICVLILTAANLAFGTIKWLAVMRSLVCEVGSHPRFVDGMLTTTVGALLGQAMPVQLGVALTRSLAGRLGIGRSPGVNLGATAYEQIFDLLVLSIAGAISVLGMILRPSQLGWWTLILATTSLGALFSSRFLHLLHAFAEWCCTLPFTQGQHRLIARLGAASANIAELPPSFFAQQFVLSALRYVAVVLRAILVLSALGMSVFTIPAIISFPLVQTIGILPITPGNLGVIEWTWSGVLVYAGAAINAAALFAVTTRIVNVAAQITILAFLFAFRWLSVRPLTT